MITIEEYIRENFGNLFQLKKINSEDGLKMFIVHNETSIDMYEIQLNGSGKYFSVKSTSDSFCLLSVFPPYLLEQLKLFRENVVNGLFDSQLYSELLN